MIKIFTRKKEDSKINKNIYIKRSERKKERKKEERKKED